ncbi:MAG: hypothetical protein MUF15_15170 [Acidobacteria bacterium]|nr:hypothetical protein [Acidobacteriota bacterium]
MKNDGLLKPGRYDDEYAYDYVDKRVEKLALYIDKYMTYVSNGPGDLIGKIFFYANYYLLLLLHYRRLFDNDQHRDAYRLTADHEKYVKEVLWDLNVLNARWFRELVDLAEKDWNEEKAKDMMKRLLSIEKLRSYVEKLDTAQYKLYEDLLFLDPEYESFLQWK